MPKIETFTFTRDEIKKLGLDEVKRAIADGEIEVGGSTIHTTSVSYIEENIPTDEIDLTKVKVGDVIYYESDDTIGIVTATTPNADTVVAIIQRNQYERYTSETGEWKADGDIAESGTKLYKHSFSATFTASGSSQTVPVIVINNKSTAYTTLQSAIDDYSISKIHLSNTGDVLTVFSGGGHTAVGVVYLSLQTDHYEGQIFGLDYTGTETIEDTVTEL